MIYYVASDSKNVDSARRIVRDLQVKDLENCYICPLWTFSHLSQKVISKADETELRLDLMTISSRLILVGSVTEEIRAELDFAKLVKMEVLRIDESGELQPFTE